MVEGLHHAVRQGFIHRGGGERHGQAGGHFLGKAGAAQAPHGAARQGVAQHLVRQAAGTGLQALGQADHAGQRGSVPRLQGLNGLRHRFQTSHRGGHDQQVGVADGLIQPVGEAHGGRHLHVGQIALVGAGGTQRFQHLGIA